MPNKSKSIDDLEKELSQLIEKKKRFIVQKKEEAKKQDARIKILISGFVIQKKNTELLNSDRSIKDKELFQNLILSLQKEQQKAVQNTKRSL